MEEKKYAIISKFDMELLKRIFSPIPQVPEPSPLKLNTTQGIAAEYLLSAI